MLGLEPVLGPELELALEMAPKAEMESELAREMALESERALQESGAGGSFLPRHP